MERMLITVRALSQYRSSHISPPPPKPPCAIPVSSMIRDPLKLLPPLNEMEYCYALSGTVLGRHDAQSGTDLGADLLPGYPAP
eukprot:2587574-Rhodomonas_salina.3